MKIIARTELMSVFHPVTITLTEEVDVMSKETFFQVLVSGGGMTGAGNTKTTSEGAAIERYGRLVVAVLELTRSGFIE